MNTQTYIASLVTLLGLLVTVGAGFLLKKRRFELLDQYAQRLTEERLKHYPGLYKLLSSTIKQIDFPEDPPENLALARLRSEINEWDSSWGALLTRRSGDKAKRLREVLYGLLTKPERPSANDIDALRDAMVGLEVALRVDLGVYAVEELTIKPGFHSHPTRDLYRTEE